MSLLLLFSNSVNQFWTWGCRASQTSLPLIVFPLQVFKCVLASTAAERRSPCQISNFSVGFWFQLSPSAAKKRQLKDLKKTRARTDTHKQPCISSEPRALNNGDVKLEVLFSRYTCVGLALKRLTGKSKRQTEGENERGSTLKADAPKGGVLQRICCIKNSDDKVFTDRQMKKGELCINTRDNEAISTCCVLSWARSLTVTEPSPCGSVRRMAGDGAKFRQYLWK